MGSLYLNILELHLNLIGFMPRLIWDLDKFQEVYLSFFSQLISRLSFGQAQGHLLDAKQA